MVVYINEREIEIEPHHRDLWKFCERRLVCSRRMCPPLKMCGEAERVEYGCLCQRTDVQHFLSDQTISSAQTGPMTNAPGSEQNCRSRRKYMFRLRLVQMRYCSSRCQQTKERVKIDKGRDRPTGNIAEVIRRPAADPDLTGPTRDQVGLPPSGNNLQR